MTDELLIDRKEISLSLAQTRMIKSAWGAESIDNSRVEKITYISDGLKVKAFIAEPLDQGEKKYPVIIWNRGGKGADGAIDDFIGRGIFGQIASWGYVVLASQYRGSPGSEGVDQFGGDDVNDILNLIPLASQLPKADTNIWGIEGWSRGGMMTYLTLTRDKRFKAAVISGGVANLKCNAEDSKYMRILYEDSFGNYDTEKFKKDCAKRSVIYFAERLPESVNMLLLHGTADDRVSPRDSIELSLKLLEYKIPFRLVLLEGGDHFLRSHKKETDIMRKEWFKRFLK